MGLKYLGGKSWAEVTREERVFCQHLYVRLVRDLGAKNFVQYLNDEVGLGADPNANWEVAYEVCFYRDLWHHRGRGGELYSPKRTFDLCLLSDDHVVVVEAKAQQGFDREQVAVFVNDKEQLVKETGVARVSLLGLASSRCPVPPSLLDSFDARLLTWRELAGVFEDDPVMLRADDIFETATTTKNSTRMMTGEELLRAHEEGRRMLVGRGGGLDGDRLREDAAGERWRHQKYETNEVVSEAPNPRNWFTLADFVRKVTG